MFVCGRSRSSVAAARPRNVRRNIRVSAGVKTAVKGAAAKVSFAIPYRCNFGQQLCLIGQSKLLGDWDVKNAVQLKWTSGDVWVAELDITEGTHDALEYKYIVQDSNGNVNRWMDGSNVVLEIPSFVGNRGGTILVNDTWDHSHDVSISFDGVPGLPTDFEVEIERIPYASSPPKSNNQTYSQAKSTASSNSPVPAYDDEMAVLQSSIERALNDLSAAMDQSDDVVEDVQDPSHPNALEVDRKVAASYNRVMALSKALKASATDLRLPQPPRCYSYRPSWRFDRVPAWVR